MKTESLIAAAKQEGGGLEQSFYKISLVDLKNLSNDAHVRNLVRHKSLSNVHLRLKTFPITIALEYFQYLHFRLTLTPAH